MSLIELKNIKKSYPLEGLELKILKGISLTIEQGEFVAIMGPSGSGKSTLMNILGCLDKPTSGKYFLGGKEVDRMNSDELAEIRNRNIGFVFQFHQLLPEFTLEENVALPALIGGESRGEAFRRARELVGYLGLGDRLRHRPAELSGGERQRAAVARALINRPQVVLADEPSGSLDSHNRAGLHRLFFDMRRDFGQTFVIVTHDETLAGQCDRTVHMCDGLIATVSKS